MRGYQLPSNIRLEAKVYHFTTVHAPHGNWPSCLGLHALYLARPAKLTSKYVTFCGSRLEQRLICNKNNNKEKKGKQKSNACMDLALKLFWMLVVSIVCTVQHVSLVCAAISINLVYYFQYHRLSFPPLCLYNICGQEVYGRANCNSYA